MTSKEDICDPDTGTVANFHAGKRTVLGDEIIDMSNGKYVLMLLLATTDPSKYDSVVHIQKCVQEKNGLKGIKGGIILPVEILSEVKAGIDRLYMEAVANGLI